MMRTFLGRATPRPIHRPLGMRPLIALAALFTGCVLLQQSAAAQTAYSTLQSVSCASGVTGFLLSPGTVNIYDGPTNVASFSVSSPLTFSWPIPTALQDSKFHVISVNVTGGTELQNSPQSFTCSGTASAYQYQVSVANFNNFQYSGWTENGQMAAQNGLLYAPSAGSIIYNNPIVPENASESNVYEYEINTGITLGAQPNGALPSSYIHYIYGSANAQQTASGASPAGTGTYHAVELYNPTVDDVGNCTATLNSWEKTSATAAPTLQFGVTVPCGPTVSMRTVVFTEVGSGVIKVWTLLDNILYSNGTSAAVGQPGIGTLNTPNTAGFSSVAIGPRSLVGAAPISPALPANQNPTTVNTSIFPTQVNIHWQEPRDASGVGVIQHLLTRGTSAGSYDTGWATLSTDFSDSSAQAQTNYVYAESERSFHGIFGPQTNIYVTTPARGAVNPRRTGVRATGSYWGAMGESIDTLSGNLNFTLPLVKAQGRNGWAVPIGLAYNSQNWRQDLQTNPSATFNWNLGQDIGYGYGWQLQLGSIVPFWKGSFYSQVDHYVYTDSTGAQHNLTQLAGQTLWTDQDSLYVGFDATANILHFRDGTFWKMGCTSGGLEADFGTMYPTELDDTNGNQIAIRYATGWGVNWPDSSGRISEIQDVRAQPNGTNPPRTFYFTYTAQQDDPIPMHLTGVGNTIGTGETYAFSYNNTPGVANVATLVDPFSRNTYGTILALTGINLTATSMNYGFGYDYLPSTGTSSGELIEAVFPLGGVMTWTDSTVPYNNARKQREVTSRTMNPGGGVSTYTFARTFANGTDTIHNATTLADPHGDQRIWTYLTNANAGSNPLGLVASQKAVSANATIPSLTTPIWSLDGGGNPYVSSISSCVYSTCATSTQSLDGYGNTSTRAIWNYGNGTSTADRTYSYTYAPAYVSQYVTNHIFNPLVSMSIAMGSGSAVTVLSNTYDSPAASALPGVSCPTTNCPGEWNSAYTSNAGALQYRGNLTQTTARGVTNTYTVNVLGTRTAATNSVKTVNASFSTATNYALPDFVNLNGNGMLQTGLIYNAFLGTMSSTDAGNSGDSSSATYDTAGRVKTATTADGSVTTYTYAASAPFTQTATVTTSDHGQNRATVTTFDGFGHTTQVDQKDSGGILQARTTTTYTASSCAPLGMATTKTLPYLPPAAPSTSTTAFDGVGQPLSVTLSDGAPTVQSVTSYSYSGNTATVTDPASSSTTPIWKTTTTDVFGNVTSVVEPDPAAPTSNTFTTSYAYNAQNSITSVTMTRGTSTQARTFNYDPTTFLLKSKTEPETGTTSYTYNGDGTVHTKTLANNSVTTYSYDAYGRSTGWGGNLGSGTTVVWDQNTIGNSNLSSFTTNSYGRVAYKIITCPGFNSTYNCVELYNYSPSGHMTGKKIAVYSGTSAPIIQIEGDFSYDEEGRLSSITYPNPTGSPLTYTYSFDSMGRPAGMAQGATSVASGATFNPAGQLTALTYASSTGTEQRAYNALNQLTGIELGDTLSKSYLYATGKNNGQITEAVDEVTGENIAYSYDSLKRLSSASASTSPHIVNRSFEEVPIPSPWITSYPNSQYQMPDQGAHTGTYSLHILPGGALFSQAYSGCTAGTTYTVSGYYKIDANQTGSVAVTINGASYAQHTLNPAYTWTQFSYNFTPAACGAQPILQIGGNNTYLSGGVLSPGTVWFDDLSVTTGGGANLLSNPGFETQTVNNWSLSTQARPTTQQAHEGVSSILLGPGGTASQTISGANPGQSYVLNGYYYITTGSTTATVNFGGGSAPETVTGTWQPFTVSGTANGEGSLILQLAASTNAGAAVYFDDLSLSAGNPANPALSWGQSFGYDGFGNFLAETVTAGSAPTLSVTADPATNRVVMTGVQYDAAGNMTNDGTQAYTYDELNRIKTVGTYLYSYSGNENKRVLVYKNVTTPIATFNLYGPNGKRLGVYNFQGVSGGWSTATAGQFTNFLYLGNKALSFSEDRIGSNGKYYPYGTPYTSTGTESQAFGTYVNDESGLLYADQRYYDPGFGRFMTADRSNANIDYRNPTSWNRYAYTNGDPVNGMDPTGLDVVCTGGTPDGTGISSQPVCTDSDGTSVTVTATQDPVLYYGTDPTDSDGITGPTDGSTNSGSSGGSGSAAPPSSPPAVSCQAKKVQSSLPGSTSTGFSASVGGHLQLGIVISGLDLLQDGFLPYTNPFGGPNGYRSPWSNVHVNGITFQLGQIPLSDSFVVQGHFDLFNPMDGFWSTVGHTIVDLGLGSLFNWLFGPFLDKGC